MTSWLLASSPVATGRQSCPFLSFAKAAYVRVCPLPSDIIHVNVLSRVAQHFAEPVRSRSLGEEVSASLMRRRAVSTYKHCYNSANSWQPDGPGLPSHYGTDYSLSYRVNVEKGRKEP